MKLVYPEINSVITIEQGRINSLIVENQGLLYRLIDDIHNQLQKRDGKAVLSQNDEVLDIYKNIELLTDVYNIDLNSKSIISKITDELTKKAVDEVHYESTMKLISSLQTYFEDLVWDMDCEISCNEINAKQLIKTFNFEVVQDTVNLSEQILKYVELVRQFLGEKLFIFVNFRGFVENEQYQYLVDTLNEHGFQVLFVDNKEYPMLLDENRLVIDIDLCEF